MKFYISREDLHRVLKGCDLGDSVAIRAYVYPHTDDLWRLVACLTAEPFMETEKAATDSQAHHCKDGRRGTHCLDYHASFERELCDMARETSKSDGEDSS